MVREIDEDLLKVQDALLVLSGHLPLFSSDKQKVARAEAHLKLRDEAFDALDRIADFTDAARAPRKTSI